MEAFAYSHTLKEMKAKLKELFEAENEMIALMVEDRYDEDGIPSY